MSRSTRLRIAGLGLACILSCSLPAHPATAIAGTFSGKVTGLISADTITVMRDQAVRRIHMYGIVSPQKGTPYGKESRSFAENMLFGAVVEVEEVPFVGTKRTWGIVRLQGNVVNEELLRKGMAWFNPKTCKQPFCSQWQVIEEEARAAKRGLWANPKAAPPWEGKKRKKQPQ